MTTTSRLAQLSAAILILAGCHDARRSNLLDPGGTAPVAVDVSQDESGDVTIAWTDYAGEHPFVEYRVQRSNARGHEGQIDTLVELSEYSLTTTAIKLAHTLAVIKDPNLTSFVDTSLVPYISYVYQVSVVTFRGLEVSSTKSKSVTGLAAQRISFYSNRDGNFEVYVMNPDGSGLANLTNHPADDGLGGKPAWSPDASKILFISERDVNRDVYVMDADGGNQVNLTKNPGDDGFPSWSPDGTRIAFSSDRDGDQDVYVMDRDGGNLIQLTDDDETDFGPAWSPDGTKIVFSSLRDGDFDLYMMNADGTGITQLTDTRYFDFDPDWSPDGRRIVWEARGPAGGLEGGIWLMNPDGTDFVRILPNDAPNQLPVWSPDGSEIAFASERDGNAEIYVMNADGEFQRNLTNYPARDFWPAWSPAVR